jgi:hypothetical protein
VKNEVYISGFYALVGVLLHTVSQVKALPNTITVSVGLGRGRLPGEIGNSRSWQKQNPHVTAVRASCTRVL